MTVNICGIPYEVLETKDEFCSDTIHFGEIDYINTNIRINAAMPVALKKETLCHEIVHGILSHLGYTEINKDESFVQALGNAIYQGFEPKMQIKAESEEQTE